MDLLCFCSVLCLLCFVRVCLYVLRGHLLGKGWPLGSRLWCLLWVCHFPIGILGQVWYLIVSIPDLCNLTYFVNTLTIGFLTWRRVSYVTYTKLYLYDVFENRQKYIVDTFLSFRLWLLHHILKQSLHVIAIVLILWVYGSVYYKT